jgi:hypothetical protein
MTFAPRPQYVQIRTYDAEDILQLLNSHNQLLVLDHPVKLRKQSALDEAKKPLIGTEEKDMAVSNSTEGRGVVEVCIKMFEITDSNEKRTATFRQGIKRMFACGEEVLKQCKFSPTRQQFSFRVFCIATCTAGHCRCCCR